MAVKLVEGFAIKCRTPIFGVLNQYIIYILKHISTSICDICT